MQVFLEHQKSKNLSDDSHNLNNFISLCNIVWELWTMWKSFLVSEAGSIVLLNAACLYGGYFCAEMPQRGIICIKKKLVTSDKCNDSTLHAALS